MKPRLAPRPQPDSIVIRLRNPAALADLERDAALVRLMLLADPAYESWSEQRQAEDQANFDAWLCSPAGQRWLESEVAAYEEEHCLSAWEGW